jgi:xylan 1,4-beta-xylosidase
MPGPVVVPADPLGPLSSAWRECVGTGRLNLALRADYLASLARVQREIGFAHIRGHGLLSDDMGVYRTQEVAGHTHHRYNFSYVDQVHDAFLDLGIRPFLELGFMPSQLASGSQTVFWWQGNVTPPADMQEWVDLVRALLRHLIDRYGIKELRRWPIEVWNEPNLDIFWERADQEAYFRLYEATARVVKEVDASLQVGGPAISPGSDQWWAPFADFVSTHDVPIDFVSRHAYSSREPQLIPFGSYQELLPPQELLTQFGAARAHLAGTALAGLPVHITEFNTSYRPDNPIHDTAYNAAYLAPVLAGGGELANSFSYWTFSDVFEELNIPTAFFHGGFGLLTHRQVAKPTYHLYTFMARMGADVLARGDDHLVCRDPSGRVTVLAWQPVGGTNAPDASERHEVHLSVPMTNVQGTYGTGVFMLRERVNEADGNAFAAWRELGRPMSPNEHQLDGIRRSERPAVEHHRLRTVGGRVELRLPLSRHEVTFIELDVVRDTQYEGLDDRRLLGMDDDRLVAEHER